MPTNVTKGNIIIGPCTSFKVDGVELGGTSGGVSIEKKQTTKKIQVDQVAGTLDNALTDEEYTVKTTLAEGTLANLQLAWNSSQAPTTSGGTTTMNLGVESTIPSHALQFTGKGPNGKTRTYTAHIAQQMTSGAIDLAKDKEMGIPVEFTLLPDLTQPAGEEYGSISEQ